MNLERKVVLNTALSNGQTLRTGAKVSVHTGAFLDVSIHPDPNTFDSARFLKRCQAGGKWDSAASVVSTSPEHFVFGLGKYVCLGRFIAIAEVKTALAVLMRQYNIRFQEGYVLRTVGYGFEILGDPEVKVRVRWRRM